jgi:hypothetical protein
MMSSFLLDLSVIRAEVSLLSAAGLMSAFAILLPWAVQSHSLVLLICTLIIEKGKLQMQINSSCVTHS